MQTRHESIFRFPTLKIVCVAATLFALIPAAKASGDIEGRTVTVMSKSWIVTLRVEDTYTRMGSTIPAAVTIDNRTGRSVELIGCPGVIYKIVLGNSKIPNNPVSTANLCESMMSPGVHVFRTSVQTTYEACGGGGYPQCGHPPRIPLLPTGTYRTQVVLPVAIPSLPKLGSLVITIHS